MLSRAYAGDESSHLVITVHFGKGNSGGVLYSSNIFPQARL